MAQPENESTSEGAVQEPENSTVDDWFGQNVARDQEVADEAAAEEDSAAEAEQHFEAEADGERRFEQGHNRPRGVEADGDEVGRDPDK